MRRKNNYVMRKRKTPKRVTLPNGRTFVARYERVPRSKLPANIRMHRTYRGNRARARNQRGQGIISTIKKIAKHPITKQLIKTGAENMPEIYDKLTSKIKNPKFKKAFQSEMAKKIVKKVSDSGVRYGRKRLTPIRKPIEKKALE